ncbi:MAG: response regulator [Candidatus Moranbacteria bacterium]|nr:response regulator [Candidatus Moranbacteria bacterium]
MAKKILLVEEEPTMQQYYEDLLEKEGYEVFVSLDGKSAVRLMNKQTFDLILLDIFMPILNGIEILEMIKAGKIKKVQGSILILTNLEPENIQELRELYQKHDNNPENLSVKEHIVKGRISEEEFLRKIRKNFLY